MPHKINYKSDFDLILNIVSCAKNEDGSCSKTPIGWPDFDWAATFWTSNRANSYVASRRGDEFVNCFEDDGKIHIVVNNHHLGKGVLNVEFHALLPDEIYPDSVRDTYDPQPLDILLVSGSGDCAAALEAELILPTLKGEPFTYEDFTPDQLADLRKPAVDAAKLANKATTEAVTATKEANAATELSEKATANANKATEWAEEVAEASEKINQTVSADEQKRAVAETLRVSAEDERKAAETLRVSAEQERTQAEQSRVSAELGRSNAETQRVSHENTRTANEQTRTNNENQRIADETARVAAESARVTEFAQIKTDAETATTNAETAAESANSAASNANNVADGLAEVINGKQDALTTSADLNISADNVLSLTDMAKMRLFIDLWNAACGIWGGYNEETGYFELNGLTDITYQQAQDIYAAGPIECAYAQEKWQNLNIRTNLPMNMSPSETNLTLTRFIYQCKNLTILNLYSRMFKSHVIFANPTGLSYIQGASKLKTVLGIIDVKAVTAANSYKVAFDVPNLETILLKGVKVNFTLNYLPKLDYESISYLITNAANTTEITVKVHGNVYAKLTGDTTNAAAAALSEEELAEWMALLETAVEKKIQFVTA